MKLPRQLLVAISVVALTLTAQAADWYVDAVHGSNFNSGTSPAQAWRTISWAVANVPVVGEQRVFVAAGRYDEALGEQFPIRMRSKLQLLGAGAASTEIVNTLPITPGPHETRAGIVHCRVAWEAGGANIAPGTVLAGFRITSTRNPYTAPMGTVGVWVESFGGRCSLELKEVELDSLGWAIRVEGFADVELSHVDLHRNFTGVSVVDFASCTASEITVVGNMYGFEYTGIWGPPTVLSISRSRIEGNFIMGILAYGNSHGFLAPGHFQVDVSDCVIAHNGGTGAYDGAIYMNGDEYSEGTARLVRSSIIDNARGVRAEATSQILTTIDSCLLQNIGDDLDVWQPSWSVEYSNISDGDFLGINGNISAPALFVDPAAHDYRLRFDSPGIDAGNPATASGTLDYLGTARSIDGDLDTVERADIGAYEFAPLFLQGSGRIDSTLSLECWGPVGATAILQFSRRALVSSPLNTPFGEFDLDPSNLGAYGISAVGQSAPVMFDRLIPNTPALIGQTFSFQARTSSAFAPHGAAYTNGVQFTVLP